MKSFAIITFVILAVAVSKSSALVCRQCANAISERDCMKNGKDVTCAPNANQCQIQIRFHGGWGPGFRIFQNCKQGTACDNNFVQNPRAAWLPTQCVPTHPNSVCRCCCNTDRCNIAQTTCFSSSQNMVCTLPPQIYLGKISCTNGRQRGSRCTTVCDHGAVLRDGYSPISICDGNGAWSQPFGQCERLTCERRGLENGWVQYSNNLYLGSVEKPTCNHGFDLNGEVGARCIRGKNGMVWSKRPAFCRERQCPERGPVEGGVEECENARKTQSHCRLICEDNRTLLGATNYYCQDNGKWSHPLPTCDKVVCPDRGSVMNGAVNCIDSNEVDSICTVTCDEGFIPFDDVESICLGNGNWDRDLATCRDVTCPPRGGVDSGRVKCTNGDKYQSVCTTTCSKRSVMDGDATSECLITGEWDTPLPKCEILPCDDQGKLRHGSYDCTKKQLVGSKCKFQCKTGYELYPKNRVENRCLPTQLWNLPKPCCTRPCPPHALMDLVIILDSSSSIKDENWVLMTRFVRTFIQAFEFGDDSTNMGIFRYNKDVDTTTEVFLKDYPNDREGFIEAFNQIPYDGSGTLTGKALTHALENQLSASSGNRPDVVDVVLLLTDGKAKDDVSAPAKAIRDTGAIVFAFGIEPPPGSGRLDRKELADIAGSRDNVIIPEGGFKSLTRDFSMVLSKQICGDPCDRA